MLNGMLQDFAGNMPEVAVEALERRSLKQVSLEDGVSRLMPEHDNGVAYRFFTIDEYNPLKSEIANYEVYDQVEMIQWFLDRKTKPAERAHELPPELLRFEKIRQPGSDKFTWGECIGGKYAEAYKRFKSGVNAPGTSLRRWGLLGSSECASLEAVGIFSVEQFAAQPKEKIVGKYPQSFVDAYNRAVQYVNGKEAREQADATTEKLADMHRENQKLKSMLEDMQAQMASLMVQEAEAPKKRGRPRKADIQEETVE